MRITRQTLLRIARDTTEQRARSDRDLLSIYLHGALLEEEPLLGGTADIDLVFIHNDGVIVEREIKRLTNEVHLDIAHHDRREYRQTRKLRVHPWMGPTIFRCKILYDPQHFMDFTQASVRGQFNRPEYTLSRARGQAEHARQMWFSLEALEAQPQIDDVQLYLRAIEHAANAVASLSGPPLTERRFLLNFPKRAEAIGRLGLYPGLLGLLGSPKVELKTLGDWLKSWGSAYGAIPPADCPPRLHPDRYAYYRRALEKILAGEQPYDVLWPLLSTWVDAAALLPEEAAARRVWEESFEQLGMLGSEFPQRVAALDAYLDMVEEAVEEWAQSSGAEYRPA